MAETQQQSSADRWLLKYGDRVYGPYSHDAMTGYIAEGRVIATSLIAPEGTAAEDTTWQPASSVDAFAESFGIPKEQDRVAPNYRSPVEQAEEQDVAAPQREVTTDARPTYGPAKGQIDRRRQPETANFIVIMDIKARYAGQLEQAIMSLGPAYKLAPNVWCVNTDSTAAGLLNDLSIHIGKTDSMFIVDATRDRTAWHNLGPETDAKLRRVWRRAF
ncbi:MAG: hypothetical protein Q7T44_07640 [Parvibaculum sp.]|nr:hypothetical protein [Parvibaculum sp.]